MATELEQTPTDHVEELVWALLDEQISEDDFQQLEKSLGSDEDAQQIYVQCVQLHTDLYDWFSPNEKPADRRLPGLPIDLPLSGGDVPLTDSAF